MWFAIEYRDGRAKVVRFHPAYGGLKKLEAINQEDLEQEALRVVKETAGDNPAEGLYPCPPELAKEATFVVIGEDEDEDSAEPDEALVDVALELAESLPPEEFLRFVGQFVDLEEVLMGVLADALEESPGYDIQEAIEQWAEKTAVLGRVAESFGDDWVLEGQPEARFRVVWTEAGALYACEIDSKHSIFLGRFVRREDLEQYLRGWRDGPFWLETPVGRLFNPQAWEKYVRREGA